MEVKTIEMKKDGPFDTEHSERSLNPQDESSNEEIKNLVTNSNEVRLETMVLKQIDWLDSIEDIQDRIKMMAQEESGKALDGSLVLSAKNSVIIDNYIKHQADTLQIRQSNFQVPVTASSPNRWKSEFIIKLTLTDKMRLITKNKAFMYLLCAAFFRFAGGYSLGYWAKSYFSNVYPDYLN